MPPHTRLRLALLVFVPGLLTLLPPRPLAAQDDPRLQDALRLAQEGASDSARNLVSGLLRVTPPTDSLYPQVLYTMGLVSRNVEDMRRNYTRVAVEYANSAWADDAVYRLGLLDYAAGDLAGSVRQLDRLRRDYPDSPLIGPAAEWAARALFDLKKGSDACTWLAAGLDRTGDDVELRNRLQYMNARCAAVMASADSARADSARSDSARKDSARVDSVKRAGTRAARSGFGVQVGAVNTQTAADRLVEQLKAAGYSGYVVKEAGLYKVRAGPFKDRDTATAAQAKLRGRVAQAPFVVQEP
ncbi:MAG TPA: SPOR domain-containing protein [Gemmatimonadales bacterium]|nr:SPOR domain-containing protein [Gemmatimonadales bacterium]